MNIRAGVSEGQKRTLDPQDQEVNLSHQMLALGTEPES